MDCNPLGARRRENPNQTWKRTKNCALLGYYAASSGNFLPIDCPEKKTSVRNYHYSLRNNPEERSSHLLRGGRLNSCNGEGSFQRKQENAVKYGARLRGWRTTESDGDASQMSYVPNGSKKIYCYYLLIFVTNSIKGIFHIHQYDNHQTTTRSVNGFISQVINRITKSMHRASLYCFYYNPLMHRYIYRVSQEERT